ncbi:MAG TPA: lasso peptide biosynthesis B2 protein [Nitrospiraceae bacterium]|nr:lasso peptide biosynthesis B2 protein [Nitrospiraceae bacterium]
MILETLTSWRTVRLIARSAVVLLVVRLGLRVAGLPEVLRWLHLDAGPRRQDLATLTGLAYYTDRWLALFPANPNGNCLPRAVALYRLARASGFPVRFQCGVQRRGTQLGGHAWLLMEDRALLESTNQWAQFAVIFSFPPTGAADPGTIAPIGRPDSSPPAT